MWGNAYIGTQISNYAIAKRVYENTKPLRGKPNFRPLEQRSSRSKTCIEKQGDDYVVILYSTPIVRYYSNGDIRLETGGWNSQSTATSMSALSPFSCWTQKGDLVARCDTGSFTVLRCGLLFRKTDVGYVPENPPPAVQYKKRVNKEEAKKARKFFAKVPVYIKTFSAAFEGGVKPVQPLVNIGERYKAGVMSDEDAVTLAWYFVEIAWDYRLSKCTITNEPKKAVAAFWRNVYLGLELVEEYATPLPYGTV